MSMQPYRHQLAAFQELRSRADIFFSERWLNLPIRPRFHSLIAGPSGTGKSALATAISGTGTDLIRVSAPAWMPLGANNRGSKETFPFIVERISRAQRSIVFIDELDKLGKSDTNWISYITGEIYDLLDGRLPLGLKLEMHGEEEGHSEDSMRLDAIRIRQLEEKLRMNTFILAAGTFQDFFESQGKVEIGFGDGKSVENSLDIGLIAQTLPRELCNRFHPNIVVLPKLNRVDYLDALESVSQRMPDWLAENFNRCALAMLDEAITVGKGCRVFEEAVLVALQSTHSPLGVLNERLEHCLDALAPRPD